MSRRPTSEQREFVAEHLLSCRLRYAALKRQWHAQIEAEARAGMEAREEADRRELRARRKAALRARRTQEERERLGGFVRFMSFAQRADYHILVRKGGYRPARAIETVLGIKVEAA